MVHFEVTDTNGTNLENKMTFPVIATDRYDNSFEIDSISEKHFSKYKPKIFNKLPIITKKV